MGRYSSVQAYGDKNTKIATVPYAQAKTEGAAPGAEDSGRNKVEKVENISGSTAGASSAEFHIYRAHRRTEMLRLEGIEEQAHTKAEREEFEMALERNKRECEERTRKLAEKRQRKKAKKKLYKSHNKNDGVRQPDESGDEEENNNEEEVESEEKESKRLKTDTALDPMPIVQIKDDGSFLETMKAMMAK